MRRPSGKVPDQPLTHMWARHREMARRLASGETQKQVAQDMGISQSRISIISNSPLFQRQQEDIENARDADAQKIRAELEALRPAAVNALKGVLEEEDDMMNRALKVKVAESILDRTGVGAKRDENTTITLEQYVQTTLERIGQGPIEHSPIGPSSLEPSPIEHESDSR